MLRLGLEYDPQPIGLGGTPSTARSSILQATRQRYDAIGLGARRDAVIQLARSLDVVGG
jgi:hypothetical protein